MCKLFYWYLLRRYTNLMYIYIYIYHIIHSLPLKIETGKVSLLDYCSFSIPMSFDRCILKAEKVEIHDIRE